MYTVLQMLLLRTSGPLSGSSPLSSPDFLVCRLCLRVTWPGVGGRTTPRCRPPFRESQYQETPRPTTGVPAGTQSSVPSSCSLSSTPPASCLLMASLPASSTCNCLFCNNTQCSLHAYIQAESMKHTDCL